MVAAVEAAKAAGSSGGGGAVSFTAAAALDQDVAAAMRVGPDRNCSKCPSTNYKHSFLELIDDNLWAR